MFRKQCAVNETLPEKTNYTKYYEHDGQLRAYANRSILMAGLFVPKVGTQSAGQAVKTG